MNVNACELVLNDDTIMVFVIDLFDACIHASNYLIGTNRLP
jgi:hypothetical protein